MMVSSVVVQLCEGRTGTHFRHSKTSQNNHSLIEEYIQAYWHISTQLLLTKKSNIKRHWIYYDLFGIDITALN